MLQLLSRRAAQSMLSRRAAQGMQKRMNVQPLHGTRSYEIMKNSFAIEVYYLMQHLSLNYAWSQYC